MPRAQRAHLSIFAVDATDAKGEPIHQTLMPKKMEKLDQSLDFRPFKFRIQAFTSAFMEKLLSLGFQDADIPIKKIRSYLWAQPCISRFNDEGKKLKVCDVKETWQVQTTHPSFVNTVQRKSYLDR